MHGKLRERLGEARQFHIICLTIPMTVLMCLTCCFSDRIAAGEGANLLMRRPTTPCDSHWTQAHVMFLSKSILTTLVLLIIG